jgi:predicted anti-sigma-YlaC factor YlaD
MTCDPEKIYLYLDDALTGPEHAQVEAHLRECATCADLWQSQRAMLADLDGLSDIQSPAWLERQIIERTYDDLTATFRSQTERRQALMVVGALSAAAIVLLSIPTAASYLLKFFLGLRLVGSVVWHIATVFFKGLSFITVGLVHGVADDAQITLLPVFLIAAMLSLVLVRLVMQFEVSANQR